MKKIMITLMLAVAATQPSFAQSDDHSEVANAIKTTTEQVKKAPSGTVYGVVECTQRHIVVNTPLGRYTIEKKSDGTISFMDITARLVSAKNGIYKVKSSLGTFTINTNKGTVTKN